MMTEKKALPRNGVIAHILWLGKTTDEVRKKVKAKYIVPTGSTIIVSRVITKGKFPPGVKTYEVEVYTPMHRKYKS